jgi:hypothetical protein
MNAKEFVNELLISHVKDWDDIYSYDFKQTFLSYQDLYDMMEAYHKQRISNDILKVIDNVDIHYLRQSATNSEFRQILIEMLINNDEQD